MKFGQSWEEVQTSAASGAGFMKYFKNGDTTFRILQEPDEWVGYWEHFNPGGFGFPCTQDRKTCPGCTSSNEKMKKASRKIAIQVLEGEYVNVYKFPKTLADKVSNRASRNGTITDRDYTITKFKSGEKVEYDLEGGDKIPVDVASLRERFADVEAMLQSSYDEAWGDSDKAMQTKAKAEEASESESLKDQLAAAHRRQLEDEPAPFESTPKEPEPTNVYSEDDLRKMDRDSLLNIIVKEGLTPPEKFMTPDELVDWLLEQ